MALETGYRENCAKKASVAEALETEIEGVHFVDRDRRQRSEEENALP